MSKESVLLTAANLKEIVNIFIEINFDIKITFNLKVK